MHRHATLLECIQLTPLDFVWCKAALKFRMPFFTKPLYHENRIRDVSHEIRYSVPHLQKGGCMYQKRATIIWQGSFQHYILVKSNDTYKEEIVCTVFISQEIKPNFLLQTTYLNCDKKKSNDMLTSFFVNLCSLAFNKSSLIIFSLKKIKTN